MRFLRLLLLPLSLIYGLGVALRNAGFTFGLLRSQSYSVPVICVGNLSTGGTGKSPLVMYLAALVARHLPVAVLSRGYGRSPESRRSGFRYVTEASTASDAGDEAVQLRRRLPVVTVAVDASRRNGIARILHDRPETRAVLLDDGFQHRYVRPGLSILLFDYAKVLRHDLLLPAGSLREWPSARYRADIMVVTRCPDPLPGGRADVIRRKLKPGNRQRLYFSGIQYLDLQPIDSEQDHIVPEDAAALLVTGIADASGLLAQAKATFREVSHLAFPDHHRYSASDARKIAGAYGNLGKPGIVVTTEKDRARLTEPEVRRIIKGLSCFFWPISVKFTGQGKDDFDREILEYAGANQ